MTDFAIRAENLSKSFSLRAERRMGLKERVVRGRAPKAETFWALRDATFDVPKGTMFGIVGHNGSGKSTALKVLAGIYRPTSGSVQVEGKLSALLELGAGFHPELTGRENIALNGAILGMSSKQIEAATEEIVDFAGLGRFIDSPVKVYSSGMYVRLGFAVAVKVDPDVLIIDEVIAVGDEEFQRKCFDYISHLRNRGSTVVLVTHSLGIVAERCDTAMWLDHGKVMALGAARDVVDAYMAQVNEEEGRRRDAEAKDQGGDAEGGSARSGNQYGPRRGSGQIRVTGVELLDGEGRQTAFLLHGRPGTIRVQLDVHQDTHDVVVGLGFFTDGGVNIAGPNTERGGMVRFTAGQAYADFHMDELLMAPGSYRMSTAVMTKGEFIDFLDREFPLTVRGTTPSEPGLVTLPGRWEIAIANPTAPNADADAWNDAVPTTLPAGMEK